jgi:hypothetical protein
VEEQPRREFASADPAPGAQDAALQELGLSAKISLRSRCRLQHFQRPTPPHFRFNASHFPRRGDEHVARRRLRSSHPAVSAFPDNVVGSACTSSFSRPTQRSLALRPAHSRGHLYVTSYTEGFSHFVTSMTAPVASGWSGCRVGLAPTGKRRLVTAHTYCGHSGKRRSTSSSGGKRAYERRLGNDRSARQSRHSIESAKRPSAPGIALRPSSCD